MNIIYYFSRGTVEPTTALTPRQEPKKEEAKVSQFYLQQHHTIRADSSDEIKLVVLQILPPKSKIKRLCKFSAESGGEQKDTVRIFEVTSEGNTWYLFTRAELSRHQLPELTTVAFPQKEAVEKIKQIFERGKSVVQIAGYGTTHYNPTFDALWYEDSDCGDPRAIAPLLGLCAHTIAEAEASPRIPEDGDTWIELGRIGTAESDDEMDYEEYAEKLKRKYPNFDYEEIRSERFEAACGVGRRHH